MSILINNIVYIYETLLDTMHLIDKSKYKIAFVVNEKRQLVGTVTDGDIRRALLKARSLQVTIDEVMNSNPIVGFTYQTYEEHQKILKEKKINYLPIIDSEHCIQYIVELNNINQPKLSNRVVLMVGGLGTRLRPLTEHVPKPMLKIGNKPILQIIIESFKSHGFVNFILCVNYKKEIIQSYFQNGNAFGVNIEYIVEDKPLGTAGALSLLREELKEPIFVMNGDLLTQVNFAQLLKFHVETQSSATMCVREYEYQIPYGVIGTNECRLISIQEKPIKKEYVNAGIYIISPEALKLIPYHKFYDMPDLFNKLIEINSTISAFPIHEYWMDIGQITDYEQANKDYESVKLND